MIISGLGSPSLEDYGLRKWHQIAGVLKCRTPAIYGMSNTRAGKPAALTHTPLKPPAPPADQSGEGAPLVDTVTGGGAAPSDPVGSGQAGPRVRPGAPQGERANTHMQIHGCTQSHPEVPSNVTICLS